MHNSVSYSNEKEKYIPSSSTTTINKTNPSSSHFTALRPVLPSLTFLSPIHVYTALVKPIPTHTSSFFSFFSSTTTHPYPCFIPQNNSNHVTLKSRFPSPSTYLSNEYLYFASVSSSNASSFLNLIEPLVDPYLSKQSLLSSCLSSFTPSTAPPLPAKYYTLVKEVLNSKEPIFQTYPSILSRLARSMEVTNTLNFNVSEFKKITPEFITSPVSSRPTSPELFTSDLTPSSFIRDMSTKNEGKEPEIYHIVRRVSTVSKKRLKNPTGLDTMLTKWTASSRSLRTIKLILQSPKILPKDSEPSHLCIHTSFLSKDYRTLFLHSSKPNQDISSDLLLLYYNPNHAKEKQILFS